MNRLSRIFPVLLICLLSGLPALSQTLSTTSEKADQETIQNEMNRLHALRDSLQILEDSLRSYKAAYGAAGRLLVKFAPLKGQTADLFGGQISLLFDRKYRIGLGGYGQANVLKEDREGYPGHSNELYLGCMGLEIGYYPNVNRRFHWGVSTFIGWGRLTVNDPDDPVAGSLVNDDCFIVEPSLIGRVNLSRFLTLDASLGARSPVGLVRNDRISSSDIAGLTGTLGLQFGFYSASR